MSLPRPLPRPAVAPLPVEQGPRIRGLLGHPALPLAAGWLVLVGLTARADPLLGLLVGLAFGGAFLSGLVGVGGAIVMIPLLLYVPELTGLPALEIRTVAGITMVQVAAAAAAGLVGHRQRLDRRLFLAMGPAMIAASFGGGVVSGAVDPIVLEVVFAVMATLAAAMMVGLRRQIVPEADGAVAFRRVAAVATGVAVGFAAGLVGAGGAFFLIPVMIYGLRIPVRVTVGTSLAIVAAAAAAGLLGKALTNQVDWTLAMALVAGALPGAGLGAWVSHRTRPERLVTILGLAIGGVAVRMWLELLAA